MLIFFSSSSLFGFLFLLPDLHDYTATNPLRLPKSEIRKAKRLCSISQDVEYAAVHEYQSD
jgi:hypothetical protein